MSAFCCDFSSISTCKYYNLWYNKSKYHNKFHCINMYTSSFSLLTFLNLINNMSRQFIYIPIPNPLPPQRDILDKIFRQSLHMYQSLHILVSNVLVWVSKYNVCNSAVFSGFSPQTPFFIAFLHSYSSWTAPISKSPRTSRHATTWLYTCVGIPPAFNCWSKFQPSHLWGGKITYSFQSESSAAKAYEGRVWF